MSNEYRLKAIKEIASENATGVMPAAPANIDFYGEDVFNAEAMRTYLPKDICKKLFATIDDGYGKGNTVSVATSAYTLPLPPYEIQFGYGKKD